MRKNRSQLREAGANALSGAGYSVTMKQLPPSERPRERLIKHGPGILSNADLLAILLRTGRQGEMVTEMAQRMLVEFGGLLGLARSSVSELCERKGMGEAKAAQLKAALELGRRMSVEHPEERFQIRTPEDVVELLQIEMGALEQENLRVVLLDTRNRVLKIETVYQGSVNSSPVRVAEVFKHAIRENSTALIVAHNHPSGDPTPSSEDVRVTEAIIEAGKLLDIGVLDHIVFGEQCYVSLKARGLVFRQ